MPANCSAKYRSKPDISGIGKRIPDQFHLFSVKCHDIKPDTLVCTDPVNFHIIICHAADRFLLCCGYGRCRTALLVVFAVFDLHKYQIRPVAGDQIDLPDPAAIIFLYDTITTFFQMDGCQ